MRLRNDLPVTSVQSAFVDGDSHFIFDRGGNSTDSEIVRVEDYSRTTSGDILAFRSAFPIDKSFEDSRTLIIGECRTDASALGFSQFIDEKDFLSFCVDRCGRENVVYRPSKENNGFKELISICESLQIGFSNPAEEEWSECLKKYSSAIGASSNRMVDFAVRGKPVVSLGESLLSFIERQEGILEPDLVFSECWKRQFGHDASVSEVCQRLGEIDGFEEFLT